MTRIKMPATSATSGVIWAAVIFIGFPIGFVVRKRVRAGRDQFGDTRVLDLNAPTAVRFYATNAADSSRSGITVHINPRLPLPACGERAGGGGLSAGRGIAAMSATPPPRPARSESRRGPLTLASHSRSFGSAFF